jgi:hypothetical protein
VFALGADTQVCPYPELLRRYPKTMGFSKKNGLKLVRIHDILNTDRNSAKMEENAM